MSKCPPFLDLAHDIILKFMAFPIIHSFEYFIFLGSGMCLKKLPSVSTDTEEDVVIESEGKHTRKFR